jgi:hypothetical protein
MTVPDDWPGLDLSSPLLQSHLTMLATKAAFHLGPDRACSITASDGEGVRRVASSDPRAAHCDEVEVAADDGPCLDALRDLQVVQVPDIRSARHWDAWARVADGVGFRSAVAFPCHLDGSATATLNVYATTTGGWDLDTFAVCDSYAELVAAMVDMCARIDDLGAQRAALQDALAAEAVIQRAVGAIMATHGCDRAEAMHVLRRGARRGSVDLPDTARAVLEGLRR